MKRNILLLGLASVFVLASCSSSDKKTEDEKVVCDLKNEIAVTIDVQRRSMPEPLVFNTPNFEVKHSEYTWVNDSTASLKLLNYEPKDLVGTHTEKQIDINIDIYARKGKSLEPGYYSDLDEEDGLWSVVTLTTAYGTIGFNWSLGQPEPGGVTIEHIDKDAICGTLALNVEVPEAPSIGIVRVNGTFVCKK